MKLEKQSFSVYSFPGIVAIVAYGLLILTLLTVRSYPIITGLNLIGALAIGRIYVLWRRNTN